MLLSSYFLSYLKAIVFTGFASLQNVKTRGQFCWLKHLVLLKKHRKPSGRRTHFVRRKSYCTDYRNDEKPP